MDLKKINEVIAIVTVLDHLVDTMTRCDTKHGAVPIGYSYLYELCIIRLLNIFDGDVVFIETLKSTTNQAIKYLMDMYKAKDANEPFDKKMERIKAELDKDNTDQLVPNTVDEFSKQFPIEDCVKTKDRKDPGDKLIDDYLASKKIKKTRKPSIKRRNTRK